MLTITTYTNTLVHEIGHNLGLRHNFKGSNDSNNYLSPAQAEALGINGIPAYSSTMDYAPSMFDEILRGDFMMSLHLNLLTAVK